MSLTQLGYKNRTNEIENSLKNSDQYIDFLANEDKIERILKLREEKNVLILGHNYMAPIIYNLSGKNERGDSLALSRYAAKANNPIILFDGVRFMAETAKILNPEKKILIADLEAGCSLADPFKAKDVLDYKARFPNIPVVTYINTYAEVKAESDYCCTSANALEVVKHAAKESNQVIFLPDTLMGRNIQNELKDMNIIYPGKYDNNFGRCEVHEKITPSQIKLIREQYNIRKGSTESAVLVHLECNEDTIKEADFAGSTSEMVKYLVTHPELERVYLGTECEMTANLASEFPSIDFVRTCQIFCQHMRKITLDKILFSLENEKYEVNVPEDIRLKAKKSIDRMLEIGK